MAPVLDSANDATRTLVATSEIWPLRRAFRISRGTEEAGYLVLTTISQGLTIGRGECAPQTDYTDETIESVMAEIDAVRPLIEGAGDRAELLKTMSPGAARNAVDCALWDLESRLTGQTAWEMAGLAMPRSLVTHVTIGIDSIDEMAALARSYGAFERLKIKLDDREPLAVVRAIRAARPDARLIVDANEAWSIKMLNTLAPDLAILGVELIEQPLPAGRDGALDGYTGSVPLCADEACTTALSLDILNPAYRFVNIKLDKTGGLTEALLLAHKAQARGLGLMVGCMLGTSLGMAPALLIGSMSSFIDLDGPLLQASDRDPRIFYDGGIIRLPHEVWGAGRDDQSQIRAPQA